MNRIKELREKNGLTMQKMESDTGIKKSTISNYELRKSNPNREKTKIMADYFNVSEAYLLGYSDDNQQLDWNSVVEYLSELREFDYKKMIEVVDKKRLYE